MKQFNFKQMAVLAAVFMAGFASCGDGGEPEEVTDNVTVTITSLPNETNGMGGSVIVYTAKPVQYEGIGDGVAIATLMNGSGMLAGDPRNGEYFYPGGEGYLLLQTIPRVGVSIDKYFHFVSKNRVTLKKGDNVFDFTKDFEILHDYGGNGILRIEGVPDIHQGSIGIHIYDYPYDTDEEGVLEDALRSKPLGNGGDPERASHTADYLALPLGGFTNQSYNSNVDTWHYELTNARFNLTGTYFIWFGSEGFQEGRPADENWSYYADHVTFTNGNATIQWTDIKKMVSKY